MTKNKFYNSLLIVAGMFIIFFVITMIGLPLIVSAFNIDQSSRHGLLILSACQAVILFILPSLVSAFAISRRPLSYLQFNHAPGWLPMIGVIFAYLIALPALNQIIFWNDNLVFPDAIAQWGDQMKVLEDNARDTAQIMLNVTSWPAMLVNLAIVALLTAFAEELFFRGTLQHTAAARGSAHTAIWAVAIFFSAMHFQVFGFIPRLLLGAWFGYLLFWSRSIYVPMFAHFLNNGVVVVCTWLSARGVPFDFDRLGVTEFGFPMPAFVSALATVVFLVYFRRFFFYRSSGSYGRLQADFD